MKKARGFLMVFFWALCHLQALALADQELAPDHVLLLNSYNQRMTWVKDIVRAVEDELKPDENNIVLHIANMDVKQFHSKAYIDAYRDCLEKKYKNSRFSLILSSDNHAFAFLRKHQGTLFPGVPVVFCGVNNFKDADIQAYPLFTGVAEIFSARHTVEIALGLHPHVTRLYIVNDYLETGRAWQRDIDASLSDLKDRVTLTYNRNLSMNALRAEIAGLGEDTLVLLGGFYADRDGRYFTYEKVGQMLSEVSHVPVYCLLEFNIGRGIVGGEVISGYYQGQAMARMGKRILLGQSPETIPVLKKGVNRPVFDYRQLERFSIDPARLPQGSLIVNQPFSIYNAYRKQIWTVGVMIGILLAIVVALVLNILKRTQAEKSLRESERRFRQLADASWEGIVIHDTHKVLQMNNMFLEMFGFSEEEVLGRDILKEVVAPKSLKFVESRIRSGDLERYQAMGMKKDKTTFPMEVRLREIDFEGGKARVEAIRDLTMQKQMEERLAQSQKMEAIGTLAGGIAHDFNNILSAVIGYAELGSVRVDPESRIHSYFEKILAAGKRARELVVQILSFSRRSKVEKRPVSMGSIVKEAAKMLRASLPSTIEIHIKVDTQAAVHADPVQLHQIVMNLCTNAGLAMRESGGDLDIQLTEVVLDPDFIAISSDLEPGPYLKFTVSDTGCGMSEEIQERIFEPFFTTRKPGEGTGMGLSVVHGIVTGMSGAINVYSDPGCGATFNIYLPIIREQDAEEEAPDDLPVEGGTERILFVDDEAFQVDLGNKILGYLGYQVTATTSSEHAWELFKEDPEAYDLMITDVTMPRMPGDVLTEKVHTLRPGFPVIICTGYSERLSRQRIKEIQVKGFTMKPLLLREIAQKIRHALTNGNDARELSGYEEILERSSGD